jgi:hypothetical protein
VPLGEPASVTPRRSPTTGVAHFVLPQLGRPAAEGDASALAAPDVMAIPPTAKVRIETTMRVRGHPRQKANAKSTFCSARIIVTPALSRIASDRGFRLASMGASRGHNDPNSSLAGYSSANLDHSLRPLDRQDALCRSPIGWVLPISDGLAPMRSRGPRPRLVLRLHALNPETERADHL